MKYLVRIGDAAFDISSIAAVEGDRVVFKDGKEPPLSRFLRGSRWREIYEKPGRRDVRLGGLLFCGRPVM